MDIRSELFALLDDVPNYQTFLSVDEMHASSHQLASDYSDVVDIIQLGKSRLGQSDRSSQDW